MNSAQQDQTAAAIPRAATALGHWAESTEISRDGQLGSGAESLSVGRSVAGFDVRSSMDRTRDRQAASPVITREARRCGPAGPSFEILQRYVEEQNLRVSEIGETSRSTGAAPT